MQESRDRRIERLGLFAVTLALEIPTMLARYAATLVVTAVTFKVTGSALVSARELAELAALGPVAWSVAALVNPAGSGWWLQQRLGAREPSKREYLALRDALEEIEATSPELLPRPKQWFVLDDRGCSASVCGDTLVLSRGLLESRHLPAVLAHELGHLRGIDARLTAAVNRLVFERPQPAEETPTETGALTSGPSPATTRPASAAELAAALAAELAAYRRGRLARLTASAARTAMTLLRGAWACASRPRRGAGCGASRSTRRTCGRPASARATRWRTSCKPRSSSTTARSRWCG